MGLGDASAGLGLHHQNFLPKRLSTHEALFFRRCRRDIRIIFAHFGAKRCRCAERFVVVLSVLLLLWLARVLRGPCFFSVGFRAFWRARATPVIASLVSAEMILIWSPIVRFIEEAIAEPTITEFVFSKLSGCSFWAAFSGSSGARTRPHVSLLAESWHPLHHLGLGWATCIT